MLLRLSVVMQMWPEEGFAQESLLPFTPPQPILCTLTTIISCGPSYIQKRVFQCEVVFGFKLILLLCIVSVEY